MWRAASAASDHAPLLLLRHAGSLADVNACNLDVGIINPIVHLGLEEVREAAKAKGLPERDVTASVARARTMLHTSAAVSTASEPLRKRSVSLLHYPVGEMGWSGAGGAYGRLPLLHLCAAHTLHRRATLQRQRP